MRCYKCNEEKDESLFAKSNRHKHEDVGLCKRCKYLENKKYREEHREQIAKNKREYWQNNVNGIRE